jgi:hypothetical protein
LGPSLIWRTFPAAWTNPRSGPTGCLVIRQACGSRFPGRPLKARAPPKKRDLGPQATWPINAACPRRSPPKGMTAGQPRASVAWRKAPKYG